MQENIVLIGFMAVGKGTTARALAKQTRMFTVDTDDLIESMEKTKIKKLFSQHGESYFRALEQQTADWLAAHVHNTIVSTGGGFYQVKGLKQIGAVVHLHNEFERILARVQNHPNGARKIKKRPLLQDLDKARALYQERRTHYERLADVQITIGEKSSAEIVSEIVSWLKTRQER